MKQTDEKGNSLTYWGGLEEPKQELPKLGTKEFNDLASVYFGGKPKQETIEEVAERLYPGVDRQVDRMLFINGVKWQQEQDKNKYSEEEVRNIANWAFGFYRRNDLSDSELEDEFNRILENKFKNILVG